MKTSWRTRGFFVSAAALLAFYAWGTFSLPDFRTYRGPYGDLVDALGERATHATEMVAVVNFDFRAFDTLLEEFILFGSVVGVVLLTKNPGGRGWRERRDFTGDRNVPPPSDAVRWIAQLAVGPLVLFGLYVVLHGHLTPGGGFQGGVVLASAPLLVYLGGGLRPFRAVTSRPWIEAAEASGAAAFLALGWVSVARGLPFLQNWVPRGEVGALVSGGVVPLVSCATGLEVAAGFLLLIVLFIELLLFVEEKRS